MSEWREISTAPKEGGRVLIFMGSADELPSDSIQVAEWMPEHWDFGPCWLTDQGEGWKAPTHWMPLPSPPPNREER